MLHEKILWKTLDYDELIGIIKEAQKCIKKLNNGL